MDRSFFLKFFTSKTSGSISVLVVVLTVISFGLIWRNPFVHEAAPGASRTTKEFLDSIGVVGHLSAQDYPDAISMNEKMTYLGVQHIRTNSAVNDNEDSKSVKTAKLLGENGVKLHFTTPKPSGADPNPQAIEQAINSRLGYIERNGLKPYTESIEPFNEYDNSGVKTWPSVLQQANAYLWSQRNRLGDNTKVLGPALIGYRLKATSDQYHTAAKGQFLDTFDYGNIHSYYGGDMPETNFDDALPTASNSQFNTDPENRASDNLESRLQYYAHNISGNKPIIITEMGYNDDQNNKQNGVDDQTAGVYMPRAFLENFRIGVLRSYSYELLDEPHTQPSSEQHFGLFRADGSPKPAALALHNMSSLLAGGKVTNVSPLNMTVGDSAHDVRTVLLQKNDDEYYLAIWRKVSVYDTRSRASIAVPDTDVKISLPRPMSATSYRNLASAQPVERNLNTASSFTVSVGADVMLVHLK